MPDPSPPVLPSASVVVITMNRAAFVRTCLQHLATQTVAPLEVVVVDASPDDLTYRLVTEEFPTVRYVRNPAGAGTMGLSRNIGLAEVSGDIVAFVDDDAYAQPTWLAELSRLYADPAVGGVGGQAKRGIDGEETEGLDDIGRFHPDGTLSGNFAADPGRILEVDHFLGANMSYRRQALVDLGGIRDGYPGTCLREDTDLSFRTKKAGWKLLYNPAASVDHVAAPYSKGQRFDLRYRYYGNRNHVVLLARNLGFGSPELRRYLGVSAKDSWRELGRAADAAAHPRTGDRSTVGRAIAGGVSKAVVGEAGALVGLIAGYRQCRLDARASTRPTNPPSGHGPR